MSEVQHKVVFDFATGDVSTVPLTESEIAENAVRAEENAAKVAEMEAQAEAKEAARESARGKLAALGLTEEEITAIIG